MGDWESKYNDLKEEYDNLQAELNEMTDDHIQLQEECDAQETLAEELQQDIETEKAEKDKIKNQHYRDRQRSMILTQKIEEHKSQIKDSNKKLMQINRDLEEARQKGRRVKQK